MVTGSLPPGLLSPKIVSATAVPPCTPGMNASRIDGALCLVDGVRCKIDMYTGELFLFLSSDLGDGICQRAHCMLP